MALTAAEQDFFDETVKRIQRSTGAKIKIEALDHSQLSADKREALGVCWANKDDKGEMQPVCITIDEFFVHECYVGLTKPYMKLEPQSLEQVIAHEIAHLTYWRHGKKHTELTQEICRAIEAE